ncbi:hypothetical protein I7I51_06520 [Histoplasma capsulatum]|uniref:Uncharacterized protein n=1 Tax=Ajellomyces capsulatus TaxID=5037 RepID=A0A8A1MM53_AJECA|nr:hypothetical protein I7I51_06520 [Histoplasma capsulatum]
MDLSQTRRAAKLYISSQVYEGANGSLRGTDLVRRQELSHGWNKTLPPASRPASHPAAASWGQCHPFFLSSDGHAGARRTTTTTNNKNNNNKQKQQQQPVLGICSSQSF